MFRTVRDLALGLRPSMLDDFGLQPALEWHVRDFSRRCNVDVELKMEGDVDVAAGQASHLRLPRRSGGVDELRAARAGARRSRSRWQAEDGQLQVSVTDDGVGLESGHAPATASACAASTSA